MPANSRWDLIRRLRVKGDHVCCIPLALPHRDGLRRLFLGDGFTGTGRFLSIRLLEMTLKPSFVLYTRNVLYRSFRASLALGQTFSLKLPRRR